MYFFTEKSRQFSQTVENYQDIYVAAIQEFYNKYSLPALAEWGDGFVQGDATDEQIVESFNFINSLESKRGDDAYLNEPIAYAFFDEDGDLQASDYFEWLDKKFIELLEEKCEGSIFETISFKSLAWEEQEKVAHILGVTMEEIADGYNPSEYCKLSLNEKTDKLRVCDNHGNLIEEIENVTI